MERAQLPGSPFVPLGLDLRDALRYSVCVQDRHPVLSLGGRCSLVGGPAISCAGRVSGPALRLRSPIPAHSPLHIHKTHVCIPAAAFCSATPNWEHPSRAPMGEWPPSCGPSTPWSPAQKEKGTTQCPLPSAPSWSALSLVRLPGGRDVCPLPQGPCVLPVSHRAWGGWGRADPSRLSWLRWAARVRALVQSPLC